MKYEEGKSHYKIGTIGYVNHKNRTLWEAIQITLKEKNSSNEAQDLTQEEQKNISKTFHESIDKEIEIIHQASQSKVDELKK